MYAYHDDPAIKAQYLARVRAHRAADEIIHGTYWTQGKGCAVGCTLHSNDHMAYERELGIPVVLAYLEDQLFELSPPPDDIAWPEQFLDAIPVGADLTGVWPQYVVRLLSDPTHGCLQHVQGAQWTQQRNAIMQVLKFYTNDTVNDKKTVEAAAEAAARAAWAAWAAEAAAEATAEAAAEAAARAAWAAWAAWAAEAARATRAAETTARAAEAAGGAHIAWQRNMLLALLRAAPILQAEGR